MHVDLAVRPREAAVDKRGVGLADRDLARQPALEPGRVRADPEIVSPPAYEPAHDPALMV